MVNFIGIPADEVLRMATTTNRAMLRDGNQYDGLARGKLADILVFDGDPTANLGQLEEKERIIAVWKGGSLVSLPDMPTEMPRHQNEASRASRIAFTPGNRQATPRRFHRSKPGKTFPPPRTRVWRKVRHEAPRVGDFLGGAAADRGAEAGCP